MNIFECIVISLCVVVVGLWGLVYLAGKAGLLEDDKKNTKESKQDNDKKEREFGEEEEIVPEKIVEKKSKAAYGQKSKNNKKG